jgi:hypothetical protein
MEVNRSRLSTSSTLRVRGFSKSLRVTVPITLPYSSGDSIGSRPTPNAAIRSAAVRHDSHG